MMTLERTAKPVHENLEETGARRGHVNLGVESKGMVTEGGKVRGSPEPADDEPEIKEEKEKHEHEQDFGE